MIAEVRELAHRIFENGYVPLRIELGSKAARPQGWQVYVPTKNSIDRDFSRFSNLGVRCGDMCRDKTCLIAIDVDVDEPELINAVEMAIGQEVPTKRGKKGATYFVRVDYEQKTGKIKLTRGEVKKDVIDVLARGSQTVIPPSVHPDTKLPYQWIKGTPLWAVEYRQLPVFEASLIDEIRGFCRNPEDPIHALNHMVWAGVGGGGNTHDTCVRAVSSMVARGWSDPAIQERIHRAKRLACERAGENFLWPESHKIIQQWIDSARAKYTSASTSADIGGSKPKRLSHGALADAFLAEVQPNILFDWSRMTWYAFIATHWVPEQGPAVRHMVERFLPEEMRNRSLVEGVCHSLRDRPELIVEKDGWDRATYLLNTPGGTYDLRTGDYYPAKPSDRISRCTSVSPNFNYQGGFWESKLREWHGDGAEDLEYHQRLAGYFCTGETREECIIMWVGPGGDGKSKHAGAMYYALGTYAGVATDTAFLDTKQSQHSEELAMLQGLRLVSLNEMSGRWREDRIKQVSGGESVTAAFKHAHNFTFKPQFKLLVTANNPPRLRSVGRDMSRRFHVQNFKRPILVEDRQLAAKLEVEADTVLGWMIHGAVKYYREGLQRSTSVIADTAEYFLDNDWAQQWIDQCAELGENLRVLQTQAYESFRNFMESHGYSQHRIPLRPTFQKALQAKGIQVKNAVVEKGKSPEPALVGIRLRFDNEIF